ncbi:MAG: TolB family protein [Actinomycetota bacterium]
MHTASRRTAASSLALAAALVAALVAVLGPPAGAAAGAATGRGDATEVSWRVHRVSVATDGTPASAPDDDQAAYRVPSISDDGRFVAFSSSAESLVAGDDNGVADVFVHDRRTNRTRRISVGPSGRQAGGSSFAPAISGDGRFVVFASRATNLARADRDRRPDVYLHDRRTGVTRLVSVEVPAPWSRGDQLAPAVSVHGSYVAFSAHRVRRDVGSVSVVFLRDRRTGTTERVAGTVTGYTSGPQLSARGRFVAVTSTAALTPDDTDESSDVFVVDRATGVVRRVDVGEGRSSRTAVVMPSMSGDGHRVAVQVFEGTSREGSTTNIWVWDRPSGVARVVTSTSDGRVLAAGAAPGPARPTAMSGNGRHVAFVAAGRLTPRDRNPGWDLYVRDLRTDALSLVTEGYAEERVDGSTFGVDADRDGSALAFVSDATELVPRDTTDGPEVFVALRRISR